MLINCRVINGAPLRLVGGSFSDRGRIEIYYNGEWGTICDDSFEIVDANVACRQLGFGQASGIITDDSFTRGTGQIWLDDIECSGSESTLDACSHSGWGEHNCDHTEDVGILCTGGENSLRLTGGSGGYEGLLEIYHNGEWGTVCDDAFTITDANVVCAQYDFGPATSIVSDGSFGSGSGEIWLDNVACSGTESTLTSCEHAGWGVHNCAHSEDVGIVCSRVRLVGGSSDTQGRVEVHYRSEWGSVCDDSFTEQDGNVVCRELGFAMATHIITDDRYGAGSGEIWLDDVECSGHEASIADCTARPWGEHNCDHDEDVAIICASSSGSTTDAVRLVGGSGETNGRLEIYHNGEWGTVCDDSFTVTDGNVVCRQLGFGLASSVVIDDSYGTGSGSIWLDDVDCAGTESSLASCSHSGWGVHNCGHNEDVGIICTVLVAGEESAIRLVDGSSEDQGRLEIYHNGEWGTVCDDSFTVTDGNVVCRQLGYGLASSVTSFGTGSGTIWLDDVGCSGTESSLASCTNRGWGIHNCGHSEDVGIICADSVPGQEGAIRLVDGSSEDQGRLEIYHNGVWGTVCDDSFTVTDGNVVCRQLGLGMASSINSFGEGSGSIWLDNVECTGSESTLTSCSHGGWGVHDCGHHEDVGIICTEQVAGEEGEVHLSGGSTDTEGLLNVYHDGEWGTVCDDYFTVTDANVVCRQLNRGIAARIVTDGSFGEGTETIWLDDVQCNGTESRLTDCDHAGWEAHNCHHSEDVGIVCTNESEPGVENNLRLSEPSSYFSIGSVLTSSSSQGRLEVFYGGQWGTVCDDNFDLTDGGVACRQLGFTGAISIGDPIEVYEIIPILLDDVACNGDEALLSECSHNGWGAHNCGHDEDVILVCSEEVDTIPPTIVNCPPDQTATSELGQPGIAISWTEPQATDDSGNVTLISRSHQSGQIFTGSATGDDTTVRYIYSDPSGNEAVCTFDVITNTVDTTNPDILDCPSNISITAHDDNSGTLVTWTAPSAIDLSNTSYLLIRTHQPGSVFYPGKTVVTYVFADLSNNLARCTFSVDVVRVDNMPPLIISCPSDQTATYELGRPGIGVSWAEPHATDASGNVTLIRRSHESGQLFTDGSTTVSYLFSDLSGNEAVCNFVVTATIVDTIPPLITGCPSDQSASYELGQQGVAINWLEPRATDASRNANLMSRSHESGQILTGGATTIRYIFGDASGNEAVCRFVLTVSIVDTTKPDIIDCPSNISVRVNDNDAGTIVTWREPSATDLSNTTNLLLRTHQPGSIFYPGKTDVTYIFTDLSNNIARCSFSVDVVKVEITSPLIVDCPSDQTATYELGQQGVRISWTEPHTTHAFEDANLISRSHQPGQIFTDGSTTVSYTFGDTSGNEAMCIFVVTVNIVDTTQPQVIDCPSDQSDTYELGQQGVTISWSEPFATDASGNVDLISRSHEPGQLFTDGSTTISYIFRDASGNEAVCDFLVTAKIVDTTKPDIINCPSNINVRSNDGNAAGAFVTWIEPSATDLSNTSYLLLRTHQPGSVFVPGNTTVTYVYTDLSNNLARCTFSVDVVKDISSVDSIAPRIYNCPTDQTITVELGQQSNELNWIEPYAIDDSGHVTLISQSHHQDHVFDVGATTVGYIFADASGNQAVCKFVVTVSVVDTTPPEINTCPPDVTVRLDQSVDKPVATVTWNEPSTTDISNTSYLLLKTHQPGSAFYPGKTNVTYIFTDLSNNIARCSFSVDVVRGDDDEKSFVVKNCPANISVEIGESDTGVIVTWSEPKTEDSDNDMSAPILSRTHKPGDVFLLGKTLVTYTFASANGIEKTTCDFIVQVSRGDEDRGDGMGKFVGNSDGNSAFHGSGFIVAAVLALVVLIMILYLVRKRRQSPSDGVELSLVTGFNGPAFSNCD